MTESKKLVEKFYDQEANNYVDMYDKDYIPYPIVQIRLEILLKYLKKINAKKILDTGCGTCAPMVRLIKEGYDVQGFDLSKNMVEFGKKELEKNGLDPNLIEFGDIENEKSFPDDKFNCVISLGVFPHLTNEKQALLNMKKCVDDNGTIVVEFRNELFAAYTLNKYSVDYYLNKLVDVSTLPNDLAKDVVTFYNEKLIEVKKTPEDKNKIFYTDILAKFHNPLTIENDLFKPCGFKVTDILFYHYHALPPIFEAKDPKLFKELSLKLEDPYDWKGNLMASTYLVVAKKINQIE